MALRHRGCVDPGSAAFVDRFLDLLTSFPAYRLDVNALTVGSGTAAAHFEASPLPSPTSDVPTVEEADWRLTRVEGPDGTSLPIGAAATLRLHNGTLQASDTCNELSTAAGFDGRSLSTKGLTMTAMGCPDRQATATVIDRVLDGSMTATVTDTTMTLTRPGTGTLTYAWVPEDDQATQPSALEGHAWHLVTVAGDPAVVAATLQIDEDGTLTGSDGCAGLTGTAVVGHGGFAFRGIPEQPPAACTQDQATTVDSFLQHGLWSVRGGRLTIGGGGAQAFSLVYTDGAAPSPGPSTAQLTGVPWTLSTIETTHTGPNSSSGSGTSVQTQAILTLDGGAFRVAERCNDEAGSAQVSAGTITFSGRHVTNQHRCPALDPSLRADASHAIAALDDMLDGQVQWSITGRELTLTKGSTSLIFER